MNLTFDNETGLLVGGITAVLILASLVGWILARRPGDHGSPGNHCKPQCTDAGLVADGRHLSPCHAERRHRLGDLIRADLLSGSSRVYYDDSDQTRRPRHIAVALLRDHSDSIRARCGWLVWAICHLHTGLRVSFRSAPQRPRRGLRAFPGTDRHHPMGADDLCLLRQPRAGAPHLGDPWF